MQELKYKILHLSKENLKFSSAHFLIFDQHRAERLHGHNYRVKVDFKIDWANCEDIGYGVDFAILKKLVKEQLDQWDEYVLLPALHRDMQIKREGESLEVRFRERRYVFPVNEVILLPLVNTSVELLSGLLCKELWAVLKPLGLLGLRVQVEETFGQSAQSAIGMVEGGWEC